eukprot:13230570-Alexandrium_andersonii.AAC.1
MHCGTDEHGPAQEEQPCSKGAITEAKVRHFNGNRNIPSNHGAARERHEGRRQARKLVWNKRTTRTKSIECCSTST